MRTIFLLALGLTCGYPLTVANAQSSYSLREECTRDRCVYYKGSVRKFSAEKEYGTSRVVIRDSTRRIIAKVRREGRASIRVEEPYRKR